MKRDSLFSNSEFLALYINYIVFYQKDNPNNPFCDTNYHQILFYIHALHAKDVVLFKLYVI